MVEIISNQFTSTVSRTTTSDTQEILSNQFTATINRTAVEQTPYNTQVIIYKGNKELTAVSDTPSMGQYKVTITKTVNCTAQLENDNKTITLLSATSNSGRINILINVENVKTFTKSIGVGNIVSTDTVKSAFSQISATDTKVSWVVKSGTSSSNMELTDQLYSLVSKNINLTADRIDLNGYVSNEEESWSINADGIFNAKDMNVDGQLSADSLFINYIDSPKYPATIDGTIDIYVNSSTGNDDNKIDDEVKYATLQGAINAVPKFMNGKTVRITLENNCTENVNINYFNSGRLFIYFNGKSVNGYIKVFGCSAPIYLYGGTADSGTGATGIIHPNTGMSFSSRTTTLGVEASIYVGLYKLKIYASDNLAGTNTDKVCVGAQGRAGIYCNDISIVNAVIGFRANNMGNIQMASSSGMASKYGFQAVTGGIIGFHDASQAGGVAAATNKDSGGQIWSDNPTFASGSATSDSSTSSAVTTTQTITIKSSYGDT